jgi:hypothetical protein
LPQKITGSFRDPIAEAVAHPEGGMTAWIEAGAPIDPPKETPKDRKDR